MHSKGKGVVLGAETGTHDPFRGHEELWRAQVMEGTSRASFWGFLWGSDIHTEVIRMAVSSWAYIFIGPWVALACFTDVVITVRQFLHISITTIDLTPVIHQTLRHTPEPFWNETEEAEAKKIQKQDMAIISLPLDREVHSLGLLSPSCARWVSPGHLGPRVLKKAFFHLSPPSSHRAGTSVNVRVTTWETGWTVSQSRCPSTAAYRTMGSATQMPTVSTSTSRVSVAGATGPKHLSWGRGLYKS
jgi:hypothetical protein